MTAEYVSVEISNTPEIKHLAEAVRESGKPHALKQGAETIAVVRPVAKRAAAAAPGTARRRHRRVFTKDDPLWNIVGVIKDDGPADVSSNVDKYLAEAYLDTHA